MRVATIKRLVKTAETLNQQKDILGAFALYWIAYEGLWARGLVKALWLRGCKVKDAEKFVETWSSKDPIAFLAKVTGTAVNSSPIYDLARNNYQLRSCLFHRGIENKEIGRAHV